jgi:hypothetical protein
MASMTHERKAMIKLLKSFWTANEDYCNERCKLIPSIVEGSWAIKMAVGQKPVILGKKLSQQYFRGKGYFEIDIDVASSMVATQILGLVSSFISFFSLIVILMFSFRFVVFLKIWWLI